jgi:hypothetical protein
MSKGSRNRSSPKAFREGYERAFGEGGAQKEQKGTVKSPVCGRCGSELILNTGECLKCDVQSCPPFAQPGPEAIEPHGEISKELESLPDITVKPRHCRIVTPTALWSPRHPNTAVLAVPIDDDRLLLCPLEGEVMEGEEARAILNQNPTERE